MIEIDTSVAVFLLKRCTTKEKKKKSIRFSIVSLECLKRIPTCWITKTDFHKQLIPENSLSSLQTEAPSLSPNREQHGADKGRPCFVTRGLADVKECWERTLSLDGKSGGGGDTYGTAFLGIFLSSLTQTHKTQTSGSCVDTAKSFFKHAEDEP